MNEKIIDFFLENYSLKLKDLLRFKLVINSYQLVIMEDI
jgi:hypothetical protein